MTKPTNIDALTAHVSEEMKEQLKARFELLPDKLKQTIVGGEYNAALFNISKSQKLSFEQLESLQLETLMALLGMCNSSEYRIALGDSLGKSEAELDAIIALVNTEIFDKVKDVLHAYYS